MKTQNTHTKTRKNKLCSLYMYMKIDSINVNILYTLAS